MGEASRAGRSGSRTSMCHAFCDLLVVGFRAGRAFNAALAAAGRPAWTSSWLEQDFLSWGATLLNHGDSVAAEDESGRALITGSRSRPAFESMTRTTVFGLYDLRDRRTAGAGDRSCFG